MLKAPRNPPRSVWSQDSLVARDIDCVRPAVRKPPTVPIYGLRTGTCAECGREFKKTNPAEATCPPESGRTCRADRKLWQNRAGAERQRARKKR